MKYNSVLVYTFYVVASSDSMGLFGDFFYNQTFSLGALFYIRHLKKVQTAILCSFVNTPFLSPELALFSSHSENFFLL